MLAGVELQTRLHRPDPNPEQRLLGKATPLRPAAHRAVNARKSGERHLPPSPNVADVTRKQRSEIISTCAAVTLGPIGTGAMWRSPRQSDRKSGMTFNRAPATAIPRPLGALEKMFWLADQKPTHFAIAADVGGSTRIEQSQDALR